MNWSRIAVVVSLADLLVLAVLVGRGAIGTAEAETGISPVVRAERLELVDTAGIVRAEIRTEAEGAVVFRLRDAAGTVRVKLAADELGSGLLLADDRTEVGVHILSGVSRLTNQPDTMITLGGPDGAKRVIRPGDEQ